MTKTVEEILEDLSYSFASPEAEALHEYIREKKFQKAKKLLLEHTAKKKPS